MRKTYPENGTKRTKTRFLLFPKSIKRETRWLEMATWEEEYFKGKISPFGYWFAEKWINK